MIENTDKIFKHWIDSSDKDFITMTHLFESVVLSVPKDTWNYQWKVET